MRPLGTPHTAVLLLVLTAFTPSILGCERRGRVDPGVSTGELPDQEVADFSVTETDQGSPQWTMYARSASVFSARNLIVAHGVRVDFFDQDGKRSSTLTAREGELHQLRRNMVARGNVVLQTAEGTRMSTEQLRFLNREQKIVSDDFVRVERGGDVLTGIGFESDPRLEHFEFKRQVRATVQTRSGGGIGTTSAPDTGGR
jgi:LPS export ABC transporter protein LptC